jgi:hypothetical protein
VKEFNMKTKTDEKTYDNSYLLDLLAEALPYVEEGEEFNKPTQRGLSKKIRAIIIGDNKT